MSVRTSKRSIILASLSAMAVALPGCSHDENPEAPYSGEWHDFEMFLLVRGAPLDASAAKQITSWSCDARRANTVSWLNDSVAHIRLAAPNRNLWGDTHFGTTSTGDTVTIENVSTHYLLYNRTVVNELGYGGRSATISAELHTFGYADPVPLMADPCYTLDSMRSDDLGVRRLAIPITLGGGAAAPPTGWAKVYEAVPDEVSSHLATTFDDHYEMWIATIDME